MAKVKGFRPLQEDVMDCGNLRWYGCPVCDSSGLDTGVAGCMECGENPKRKYYVRTQRGGCEDLVVIPYHCVAGHNFDLVIHNHKGSLVIGFVVDGKTCEPSYSNEYAGPLWP